MAKKFETDGDLGVDQVFQDHEKRSFELIGSYQKRVAELAGRRTAEEIDKVKKKLNDEFQREVQDYLQNDGSKNIQKVTNTTRKQVRNIIATGQLDNLSSYEIRKRIEQLSVQFSLARSAMIARTEIGIAYSKGSYAAAKTSGVSMKKEWVSAPGENAREFHQDLDGEQLEMEEYFNDGFSQLLYPRDPNANPESIINCRCAVVYVTED